MVIFNYECKGCRTLVRGEEKIIMRHVRHGKVIGETQGTYDSYGRVYEDEIFSSDDIENPNSHQEILKSCFKLKDGKDYCAKMYKGEPYKLAEYRTKKVSEGMEDLCKEMFEEWAKLEDYKATTIASGIVVWHPKCFEKATEEEKNNLTPSESGQVCEEARVKFS